MIISCFFLYLFKTGTFVRKFLCCPTPSVSFVVYWVAILITKFILFLIQLIKQLLGIWIESKILIILIIYFCLSMILDPFIF
ncbi:hypothetical protein C483_07978 [Natrialba hulunbeirensis JCM 10989]|uniref:Uncharacterized protein n=1 Tax=Natrialba hulunbeirensis JCM 10989 TaxID=1227493 RepID=M0A3D2_9EURY|nr:hypothetical protein C483_07978 [Natrialba hulunbeirensis JCM 10989]